ncbi:hypothetical protein [Paraflavitalea speifideaquila]|uniref:hypothetical protein n=1 Tax=Paraflavitalea speifideaquila TaxID=3076558 RepID=UPI0028E5F278|nr:hypothetical protein [Paraflavitalea speifideiaquila]
MAHRKRNADNSQVSSISYVNVPYTSIADSTIKVTDDEVRKFVEEHKEGFKQEKVRGIEYVLLTLHPVQKIQLPFVSVYKTCAIHLPLPAISLLSS